MILKEGLGRKAFLTVNNVALVFLASVTIYPLLYVLFASLSDPLRFLSHNGLLLSPLGMHFEAYKAVFKNQMILTGYINTIIVCVCSLALGLALTILGAYFFTRKNVMHQKKLMLFIVFTMFFSGGMIPNYLVLKAIGFENNLLVLIIPGAINTTNLIILRTAFFAIPRSLEESATIDGAGHFRILTGIMVPLAMPTIAVISLYILVAHWNSWFNASIFLRNRKLFPLQLILRELLIQNNTGTMDAGASIADKEMISEIIKYAVIVVATMPILCVYPFIQKFFVKGVMIGAVKG